MAMGPRKEPEGKGQNEGQGTKGLHPGIAKSPGQSQKEGREDQRDTRGIGEISLRSSGSPGHPDLPAGTPSGWAPWQRPCQKEG